MAAKRHQVMLVVSLSMMFYFRHSLFDCLKYTKNGKDNLLKIFLSVVVFKSAKEFRFLAFNKINIYTIETFLFGSFFCAKPSSRRFCFVR